MLFLFPEGELYDYPFRIDPRELEDQCARIFGNGPGGHRAQNDHYQVLASHKEGQN